MFFNTINNVNSSGEIFMYLPIQSGILRYTGSNLTPTFDGFDSRIMTRSNNITAKFPGIYTTTFTLVNGFKWWDGTTEPKETFFEIKRKLLTSFPSISTTEKRYTGNNITASFNNISNCTVSNNIAHKDAGTYWVSVTPQDYYAFPDDSTAPIILKYTIQKVIISDNQKNYILNGQVGNITYNGKAQSPSIRYGSSSSYDIIKYNSLILDGDISGVNVGNYVIKVKPAENYSWEDGTTEVLSIPWSIQPAKLTKPTGTFTTVFNERIQSPNFTNYIPDLMVMEGEVEKTSPGEYSVNIYLKDENNYTWADGTKSPVTLSWSITNQTITKPVLLQNAFQYNGYAITVELSNCDMSLVTLSGTYSTSSYGLHTFTVRPKDGYQWDDLTTDELTFTWIVTKKDPSLHIFSSWKEIAAVTKSGFAELMYEIGSFKEISFNKDTTYISFGVSSINITSFTFQAYLIGIDHNSNYEGIRRTHWCIGRMVQYSNDIAFNSGRINSNATNEGGWANSLANTKYLVDFYDALEDDLKSVIADTTKYTDNTGNNSNVEANVTSSTSKIFLMSEYEVTGNRISANQYEQDKQEQYDYYKNGNTIIRKLHSNTINGANWYTRSPVYSSNDKFICFKTSGSVFSSIANNAYCIVPCFTIA